MDERVGDKLGLGSNKEMKLDIARQSLGQDVVLGEGYEPIPTGTPKTIRESKNAWNYCSWLRAGWSCEKVSAMAKETYREEISDETFRKLQLILRERSEIKPNYKAMLLTGEAPRFDVIQEMRNVIALHFRRIAEIYLKEAEREELDLEKNGKPYISSCMLQQQEALSRDLAVLFQMEMKVKEFDLQRNVKMGIVDNERIIDIEASRMPSEYEIKRRVSEYTDEQAFCMRKALEWAQKVYLLDLPELQDEIAIGEYAQAILAYNAQTWNMVKVAESVKLQYHEYWFGMSQEIRVSEHVCIRTK